MELNRYTFKRLIELIAFFFVCYWLARDISIIPKIIYRLTNLLSPVLFGILIAFIINIPVTVLETNLLSIPWGKYDSWRLKLKRPISLTISLIFVFGIISLFLVLVLPELQNTVRLMVEQLPDTFSRGEQVLRKWLDKNREFSKFLESSNIKLDVISKLLISRTQNFAANSINIMVNLVLGVMSSFLVFILALLFAIYGTLSKEKLGFSARKLCYAFFPKKTARNLIDVISYSIATFTRYISAQVLEALILGTLVFVGMLIFKMPYALVISALVVLFAMIPIFGIYISGALGCFLILLVNPSQALGFLIMLLVIQQFEGNVIYPNVVGNKIGLPPILVFTAVVLGGRFFGFVGLLLAVPVTSVAYSLIKYHAHIRVLKREVDATEYSQRANIALLDQRIEQVEYEEEEIILSEKRILDHKKQIEKKLEQVSDSEVLSTTKVTKAHLPLFKRMREKIFRVVAKIKLTFSHRDKKISKIKVETESQLKSKSEDKNLLVESHEKSDGKQ
ncbi:MAG: AI-2E family transporter [Eubacteriales bacterium]|nr:AI-2E family transporter [Eubacteriales bacterium]